MSALQDFPRITPFLWFDSNAEEAVEFYLRYHSRLLSGRFRESALVPLETVVRFLRPDLAIIHWSWKIQGDKNEDLTPRKPRFGLFTMIAEKKDTGWLIIEAQNTNQMPGPDPELNGIKPPIVFPNEAAKP